MGRGKKKLLGATSRGEKEWMALLFAALTCSCMTIYFANRSIHHHHHHHGNSLSHNNHHLQVVPSNGGYSSSSSSSSWHVRKENKKEDVILTGESNHGTASFSSSNSSFDNWLVKGEPPTQQQQQQHTISNLVAWILLGKDKDIHTQHAALSRLEDSPHNVPLEFLPGTLPHMNHVQTLQHCFVNPTVYEKHFRDGSNGNGNDDSVLVSYSERYHLAYVMLPKSASSTSRHVMKTVFHASERRISLQPNEYTTTTTSTHPHPSEEEEEEDLYVLPNTTTMNNTTEMKNGTKQSSSTTTTTTSLLEVITFVRDPLTRFYSQYEEAYIRTAPWQKQKQKQQQQQYSHPFPYLYENISSYQEYEDIFCPIETRKDRKDCVFRESQENGTLVHRFERFVKDYDGRNPFDVHLSLQVPMLSSSNGLPLYITQIYNTSSSIAGWQSVMKQFLGEENATSLYNRDDNDGKGSTVVIEGRSYPRRFNSELVSIETQRRICKLVLLDYCCLNIPLPRVCQGMHYSSSNEEDGSRRELFCTLDRRGYIQPGILPS